MAPILVRDIVCQPDFCSEIVKEVQTPADACQGGQLAEAVSWPE
jgi:hypothetical protein